VTRPPVVGFAVTDSTYTACWLRAYRALYDRYRLHPGFQGYYLLQPAGEFTIEDKPWEGIVAGYEPPMRAAFRQHLQDTVGLTLERLNRRWDTHYRSWDEVPPPLPDFQRAKSPSIS
jgi:hypothetical protein